MSHRIPTRAAAALGVLLGCTPKPENDDRTATPAAAGAPQSVETRATVLAEPFGRPQLVPALVGRAGPNVAMDFGWEAPCRVPARHFESNNDGGSTIVDATLEIVADGDGFELHFDALTVAMLADVRLGEDAAERERLVLHAATLGSLPTRRVGPKGQDRGPGDTQAAVERAVRALSPDDAAAIGAALRSPELAPSRDAAGERMWRALVGEWIGFTPQESEESVDFRGSELQQHVEWKNLGRVESQAELSLVEVERRLEGPSFTAAVLAAAVARANAEGREAPPAHAISKASRTEVVSAAIDPERGLPHHALYQSVFVVNDKQQVEVEEWAFDWAQAEGCGSI